MRNNNGFTLIELLATMVILGIIMAIAVPNVMGILTNSRNNTYVEDAKKFISLVEYKVRSGKIKKPSSNGACIIVPLKVVDNSEFENAPNEGDYDKTKSVVVVYKKNNQYLYSATLLEFREEDSFRGLLASKYDDLYSKKASELVKNYKSQDIQIEYDDVQLLSGFFAYFCDNIYENGKIE